MYKKVPRHPYDLPLIGFGIGLVGPVIGFFLYYLLVMSGKMDFEHYLKIMKNPSGFAAIISLSLFVNLAAFLIAYKFEKFFVARGVLIATFVYGVYIVYLKFMA